MKFYLIGSTFSAGIFTSLTPGRTVIEDIYLLASDGAANLFALESKAAFAVLFLSIYIVYSTYSVAYAYRLNTRAGFSHELRVAFIRNHV
jgi:hypothetical protein